MDLNRFGSFFLALDIANRLGDRARDASDQPRLLLMIDSRVPGCSTMYKEAPNTLAA
jgi:hypothetical protein